MVKKSVNRSVAVMGLGTFGEQIVKTLYDGGVFTVAVDRNQPVVDRMAPFASKVICCDITNKEVLQAQGIFDVDVAVVALRRHFDITVLVTNMLKKAGVAEIMVQVDTEQEADAIRAVGATSVVFPQRDMAIQIAHDIISPNLTNYLPLGTNVSIVDIPLPDSFIGKNLIELDLRKKYNVTVIAIRSQLQQREHISPNPSPEQPLQEGVALLVMGKNEILQQFKEQLG